MCDKTYYLCSKWCSNTPSDDMMLDMYIQNKGKDDNQDGYTILSIPMIQKFLFFLAPTASGTSLALVQLNLRGLYLINVNALSHFNHVQVIDLSCNKLSDLTVLSTMPHLQILNVSWNLNSNLLDFKPPICLRKTNYAHNLITGIPDLSHYWALKELHLDYNYIECIYGLENCKSLTHLDLAGNLIKEIKNLNYLPLQFLNLSHNELSKIEGLETLFYLEDLDLSNNRIKHLEGIQFHAYLKRIILFSNEIKKINEVIRLQKLPALFNLDLRFNPLTTERNYYSFVLFKLPKLKILDGRYAHVEDKVAAVNMLKPPPEVYSIKDHLTNRIFNFSQPLHVRASTSQWGQPPHNLFVLVGPTGSGKTNLVTRLEKDYGSLLGRCISHTTRAPRTSEIEENNYYFVTMRNFESWHQHGQFVETATIYGERYGLSLETIDHVARNNSNSITHMELEGAMSLQHTYFQPKFIFVMPSTVSIHESRLETMKGLHESIVREVLQRRTLYLKHHHENPGFFMSYVNTDEPERAFKIIFDTILDYLNSQKFEEIEENRISSHWKPQSYSHISDELAANSLSFRRNRARLAFTRKNLMRALV